MRGEPFFVFFGSSGKGDGQFYSPHGLAVDQQGHYVVADTYNHRIQIFTRMARLSGSLGLREMEKASWRIPLVLGFCRMGILW